MSHFRLTPVISCLVFASFHLVSAQSTRSTVSVVAELNDTLCAQDNQGGGPTQAQCSGSIGPGNGGFAFSGSDFSDLSIYAVAKVVPPPGDTLYMTANAGAEVSDVLTVINNPPGSSLYTGYGFAALPGGTAQAIIQLTVVVSSEDSGECQINAFGHNSCTTQATINSSGIVNLQAILLGQANVVCGPPDCAAASSIINVGYKVPGSGQNLIVAVIDSNGNPVKGAQVTSASGYKYPGQFASQATLISSPNPSTTGEPVTFTATVTSFGRTGVPTGKVAFRDSTDGTNLGVRTLNSSGVAKLTTSSLMTGTHVITAVYGGDDWSGPSEAKVTQVVN